MTIGHGYIVHYHYRVTNDNNVNVLGPNRAAVEVREMAVVDGTGAFRLASAYCQARTHSFNAKTGDATVEYNAYLLHD
ncbi:unnamed protein product [Urochloa humidicola]